MSSDDLLMQNTQEADRFDSDFYELYEGAQVSEDLAFGDEFLDELAPDQVTPEDPTVQDRAIGAGRDIGLGIIHSPRSALRGARNGAQNMVDLAEDLTNFTGKYITGNDELNVDFPEFPEVNKPATETVTGNLIEGISQFLVGLKGVDKVVKGSKTLSQASQALRAQKGGKLTASVLKGASADLAAFDAQEERLSNIIQDTPLANPVTEYLQADPEDGQAEAVLKQALEGVGIGGIADVFVDGVRIVKRGRNAKVALDEGAENPQIFDTPIEEEAGLGLDADDFEFLGDASSDDFLIRKQKKLDDAAAEVEGAFGKTKQIKEGANQPIEDFEINFARIDGPDDIKQLMDEMVNKPELKPSIDAERRGVRDVETTLEAAQDIDGFEELMARRTGDAFNAETIVAARRVYYQTTEKLMEAARKAAGPNASDLDQFNFRKMVATHHAVQKEFMGVRAEAGRALQAWNIPVGGGGAENVRALEQVLTEFGGPEASKDLAKRIAAKGDALNTSQLNQITTKAATARTADAVTEAWTLGLLTSPTTHVVNVSSNVLTGLTLGAERYAAAFVKDSPVTFSEANAYFSAFFESQKMAMKNAAEAFRTGQTGIGISKLDLPRTRATAKDILDPDNRAGIFSSALDAYGNILSKYAGGALAAGDEYSKTVLYQAQIRALAVRDAASKGMSKQETAEHVAKILADPPSNIRADAVEFANYGTFTNQLGKTGQEFQGFISRHPTARFVMPFVRTPANIFKFTFSRTPLGLLSKKMRDDIGAGGVRKATAMARLGMGTSVMALGADLAMNGQITGAGPSDPKTRSALRRTGWQPYSVKIDDTYYSYARFEPMATILGMSADLSEVLGNYEAYDLDAQREADELVTAAAIAVGNQAVGKTFLSGFADLVEVLSDPGRYGERYIQRFAGSAVPSGVASIERAADPAMSQVFNIMDQIKSRTPGLSDEVAPRRNIWAEEIQTFYPNPDSLASASVEGLISMFNPVYYSQEKDAPVDRWMLRNGFSINMPSKRQSFDEVRLDLRDHPEIYDRLIVLRGQDITLPKYGNQNMKTFFENLVKEEDPFGRHASFFNEFGRDFDDQQNFISKVVRDYTTAAKKQLEEEYSIIQQLVAQERENSELLNSVRPALQEQTKPLP